MSNPAVATGPRVPPRAVDQLLELTSDVFASMVGHDLVHVPEAAGKDANATQIVGTVAFAGSWTGYVAVATSQAAARDITAALLGADPSDVDAQVRDAVGEVVNMVAGGFRTRMVKPGDSWTITLPMVATGESVTLAHPRDAFHAVHDFRFRDQRLEVHLIVTRISEA